MKPVIGVHFWERQARLCIANVDSVSVAEVPLPGDIKRLNIVAADSSIRTALKTIDTFVKEHMNLHEYSLVVAVSDDTGLKETQLLYKCAADCGVDIIRTVTETMAMAYYAYVSFDVTGPAMMAFASPAKLAVAQYYLGENAVVAEDTFVAERWSGSSLKRSDFLTNSCKRFFDLSDARFMLVSGASDKCMDFNLAMENYASKDIRLKVLDDQCVIEGIGYICGRLEGREAFQGIHEEAALTPYDVFVSVNGKMYSIMEMNTLIPCEARLEVENYPESARPYDEIIIYEKRGVDFVKSCRITIPKEEMEFFYQKACEFTFKADEDRRIIFEINNVMSGREARFKLIDYMTLHEAEEVKPESISDFITRLIPVIDDLEYAIKYAGGTYGAVSSSAAGASDSTSGASDSTSASGATGGSSGTSDSTSGASQNPYLQGIIRTYEKAIKILEENDVQVITGIGKEYDYNYQTAVMHVDDEDLPPNTVKDVMQSGYVYKGKVLRTASVVVAN